MRAISRMKCMKVCVEKGKKVGNDVNVDDTADSTLAANILHFANRSRS